MNEHEPSSRTAAEATAFSKAGQAVRGFLSSASSGILLSAVVALAAAMLAKYLKTPEAQLPWVMGILAAIFSLQLRTAIVGAAITPKLAELERSVAYPEVYEFVLKVLNAWEACKRVPADPEIARLFRECLEAMTHAPEWSEVPNGRAIFGETRELTLITELIGIASKNVDAVSFGDEEFWSRPEGANYLAETARAVKKRGLKVVRIFVLTAEQIRLQRDSILTHRAAGIECYILDPPVQVQMDKEDFVIYDNKMVRYARALPQSGLLKTAYLSVVPGDLASYRNRFQQMKRRSVEASAYYAAREKQETPTGG